MCEEPKQGDGEATETAKQEEKVATEQKEEKKEEKKEEAKASPVVLLIDLHCVGCTKKIEKSILKCRGVEEVEIKIEKNEVIVKGIVDPHALCATIQKKTSRNAKILSPHTADSTKSDPPGPQSSGIATVELLVNMHCEACAQHLRKTILKMRGVQAAETNLSAKKIKVTGNMNENKLLEYIYRRTGKTASIITEKKEEEEKKAEETQKSPEEKNDNAQKEESVDEKVPEGNKEEKSGTNIDEDMVKRMMHLNSTGDYNMMNQYIQNDDEMSRRIMMMMHHWMPMPMSMPTTFYVLDRPQLVLPPPPQMFSDENPNACSIS